MKTVSVEITGINPLLVHRFTEQAQQPGTTRKMKVQAEDSRTAATRAANIRPDGTHYVNAFSIVNAVAAAGANHKMRGSRKSCRFIVPSAVRVKTTDVDCSLTILTNGKPAKTFEVDSRPVTIPATKGRIMRHRPRYENWSMKFDLEIQDDLLDLDLVHQLLNEAGQQVGIGDFRPEKRGPFGTFRVTSFTA
jgi:hypothetical protein